MTTTAIQLRKIHEIPATREQAEEAAALLLTLQELRRELSSRLKEWVKDRGEIAVGDMTYGVIESTEYELDPQAVTQLLLDSGIEREAVWELLTTTKTALLAGLRKLKRKELLDPILAAVPSKDVEKIGFSKIK